MCRMSPNVYRECDEQHIHHYDKVDKQCFEKQLHGEFCLRIRKFFPLRSNQIFQENYKHLHIFFHIPLFICTLFLRMKELHIQYALYGAEHREYKQLYCDKILRHYAFQRMSLKMFQAYSGNSRQAVKYGQLGYLRDNLY